MAKEPGRNHRKEISRVDFIPRYSSYAKAEAWFVEQRRPHGIC